MFEYNIPRQIAANTVWVSLRSIDRYAFSWKLKYKKIKWRVLFNEQELIELKMKKNTEFIDEASTNFNFRKNRIENNTIPVFNSSENINYNLAQINIVDYVRTQTERDMYKNMYEIASQNLKEKQHEIEKINFKIWEISSKQNIPFIESEKNREMVGNLKKNILNNEKYINELKEELSFQRIVKWVFISLLLITIVILSLWYVYTFKI